MRLTINGELRDFDSPTDAADAPLSVAVLVDRLQLAGKRIAVEHNGEIVPRSRYAETPLADGDHLEIVVAVGGG